MKLYRIFADYRKSNPNHPCYYVSAETEKMAKDRFKGRITWLDIYEVELCREDEARKVLSEPMKHIII